MRNCCASAVGSMRNEDEVERATRQARAVGSLPLVRSKRRRPLAQASQSRKRLKGISLFAAGALSAVLSGCGIFESAESSGCTDSDMEFAEEIANDYDTHANQYCDYGTTWLVMVDGDSGAFERVLGELQRDGWQARPAVRGQPESNWGLFLPGVSVGSHESGWTPYIAIDSARSSIELNAGSGHS